MVHPWLIINRFGRSCHVDGFLDIGLHPPSQGSPSSILEGSRTDTPHRRVNLSLPPVEAAVIGQSVTWESFFRHARPAQRRYPSYGRNRSHGSAASQLEIRSPSTSRVGSNRSGAASSPKLQMGIGKLERLHRSATRAGEVSEILFFRLFAST